MASATSPSQAIELEKYKQTILFLLKELGGSIDGKVKLAKLLYFIDFDHFEQFEASVTGDTYIAEAMGPLGANFYQVIKALTLEGLVAREDRPQFDGLKPTMCLRLNAEPNMEVFTADEVKDIRRVAHKYGSHTGESLKHIAHKEAPFVATPQGEEIMYPLAFYRGTAFAE
jgi:uncharacterized phage-associated protein